MISDIRILVLHVYCCCFFGGRGFGSVLYWPIVGSREIWKNSMRLLLLMNVSLINSKLSHATPNQYQVYIV